MEYYKNGSYLKTHIKPRALEIPSKYKSLFENYKQHYVKISSREANRLETSLISFKDSQKEKIVVLHYPPVFCDELMPEMIDVMKKYDVKRCFYGHLHGDSIKKATNCEYLGIKFQLISSDSLEFCPLEISKNK